MNIALVISTLGAGGAERVMTLMANHWAVQGHSPTLITLDSAGRDFYPVHHGVRRVGLGLLGDSAGLCQATVGNLRRVLGLRTAIRKSKPDVVVSFIEKTNVLTLLSTMGLAIPVVVSERIDPRYHDVERLWSFLRWAIYRRAAALVVQTNGLRDWAEQFVDRRAVCVISNPLMQQGSAALGVGQHAGTGRTVVAMGRLVTQKGFDILINAFARCASEHPEWNLIIIGEGPERKRLEEIADHLNIGSRVRFTGRLTNPLEVLRKADLFVLSSRYEGFPNALIEAMACGLPVISTDCPSGPREIIRDGVDGVLVSANNIAELAVAMDRLMGDELERQRLSSRAVEISDRLGIERVMGLWDELLHGVSISSPDWNADRVSVTCEK